MVLLLSLRPSEALAFHINAGALLIHQAGAFAQRFSPTVQGLRATAETPDVWAADSQTSPFLGWKLTAGELTSASEDFRLVWNKTAFGYLQPLATQARMTA